MTLDTYFPAAIAICVVTVALQIVAYRYGKHAGLAAITVLPFVLNGGFGYFAVRSFELCKPPSPGCEMATIAIGYGLLVVAAATALTLVSAIVDARFGRRSPTR